MASRLEVFLDELKNQRRLNDRRRNAQVKKRKAAKKARRLNR